jgi:hypothetical protein
MKPDNVVSLWKTKPLRRTELHPDGSGRARNLPMKPPRREKTTTTTKRKRLTTVGELCAALFAHLNASEPQIPVGSSIITPVRGLFQDLKRGRFVRTPPAYFSEILTAVYWNDAPTDAERCGLPLLMCIGYLSEAMHYHEQYWLPVSQAALILFYFHKEKGLRFTRSRGQWWVKSDPHYEERFGTVVRVKLSRAPQENPLDLAGPLDQFA